MRYGTVCSGIGAPEVAWAPLGWQQAWCAEVDPFCCALLEQRFPGVPNLGDITAEDFIERARTHGRIDVLCGGTPCQSFSVAGLRGGLADSRGSLALRFLQLADALRPRWLVWENVPGVLSSNGGRDFGAILGGFLELGYGFAYRVLDAQYFGVPQRRRRVFVVGCLGDWRRAAAVLFERHSLSGNSPPSREAGASVAGTLAAGAHPSGFNGQDAYRGNIIARPLKAGGNARHDATHDTYIVHTLKGEGFDASEDGTGRGVPLVPIAIHQNQEGDVRCSDVMGTLSTNSSPSNRNTPMVFQQNQRNEVRTMDIAGALSAEPGMKQQNYLHTSVGVRRLMPIECERLQGFPDGWTAITYRNKPAADGPRYKALGNSMAVPVVRWIGERISAFPSPLAG